MISDQLADLGTLRWGLKIEGFGARKPEADLEGVPPPPPPQEAPPAQDLVVKALWGDDGAR